MAALDRRSQGYPQCHPSVGCGPTAGPRPVVQTVRGADSGPDGPRRFRAALTLLADEPEYADGLVEYVVRPAITPEEVLVTRDALVEDHAADRVVSRLRSSLAVTSDDLSDSQLCAAGVMAGMIPSDGVWQALAGAWPANWCTRIRSASARGARSSSP